MEIVEILDGEGLVRALVGFTPDEIHARLLQAAHAVRDHWADLAREKLHATAAEYDDGLKVVDVAPGHVAVVLTSRLANLIERGAPPWDLRLTVLRSPKAKRSKRGHLYLSVPFRHGTPDSDGRAGRPMPRHIHDRAKRLRGSVSGIDAAVLVSQLAARDPAAAAFHMRRAMRSASMTLWGGIPGLSPGDEARLPAGLAERERDYHATDRFAGMVRMEKQYAKARQSYYMTWRTISTNPASFRDQHGADPRESGKPTANWMHPGFPGLHLVAAAADFAEQTAIPAAFTVTDEVS